MLAAMAKFEKQLHASQKFLAGLTGLPHFSELREKQLQACLKVLDGLPSLSTSAVANWLDILDFSIWGPEGAAKLQTAMAIKETAGETPGATGRRSLQDYTELPRFIPADLWNVLLGSETGRDRKLALLAQHCAKLGLRCPSEPTCALILTLAYCSVPEPRVMEEREWYDQLKIKKPVIKKHLTGNAPAEYLLTLPSDVLGLPVGIRTRAASSTSLAVHSGAYAADARASYALNVPVRDASVGAKVRQPRAEVSRGQSLHAGAWCHG